MTIRTGLFILAGAMCGLAAAQIVSQETQEDRLMSFAHGRTTAELAFRRDLEELRAKQREMSVAWEDMAERVQQAEMIGDIALLRAAQAKLAATSHPAIAPKPQGPMLLHLSRTTPTPSMTLSAPLLQAADKE